MPSIYNRDYYEQEEADELDPEKQAEIIRKARERRRQQLEAEQAAKDKAEPPKP